MGLYDTVGKNHAQLKIHPTSDHYAIGDSIPVGDGVYLTYEGWFIVHEGKVVLEGDVIRDKWGNYIDYTQLLTDTNPIRKVVDEVEAKYK